KIKEVERLLLIDITHNLAISPSEYSLDEAHRAYLQAIRNEVDAKLKSHDTLLKCIALQLPPNLLQLEKEQKILAKLEDNNLSMQQIYQQISLEMRNFVKLMIEECKDVIGEPPCKYSIICFGSLARDEATPYSDLEFGVLIEDIAEKYYQQGILYYEA